MGMWVVTAAVHNGRDETIPCGGRARACLKASAIIDSSDMLCCISAAFSSLSSSKKHWKQHSGTPPTHTVACLPTAGGPCQSAC